MYFSSNQIYLLKESKNYITVLEYYLTILDRHIQQPMTVDVVQEQRDLETRISIFLKCKDTLFFLKEWQFSDILGESILSLQEIHNLLKYIFMDMDTTIQLIREHINQVKGQIQTINSLIDERIEELKEDSNNYIKQIDQTIEISIKEHETLRNEILQNMSNRSQLILLGLAAIFTVAGLALTPLTGLLTTETTVIEPPANVNITDNTQDKKKLYEINLSQSSEETKEEELKITRKTTEETIKTAMIPVIIVLGWIIPLINTYIIYRVLNWTEQILTIGKYIRDNIEEKIDRLSRMKFRISSRLGLLSGQDNDIISRNLYWERYLSKRKEQEFRDYRGIVLIIGLFIIINIVSFLAANILFISDYVEQSTYNDFKISYPIHPFISIFILIFFIIFILAVLLRFTFDFDNQPLTLWKRWNDFLFCLPIGIVIIFFVSLNTIQWIIENDIISKINTSLKWILIVGVILGIILWLLETKRSISTFLERIIDDLTSDRNIKNWILVFLITIILTSCISFLISNFRSNFININILLESIFIVIPFFSIIIVSLIAFARLWNIRKAYDRTSSTSNQSTLILDEIKDKDDYISEIARENNGLINLRINDDVSIDVLTLTAVYKVVKIDDCNTVDKINVIRDKYMTIYQQILPNHDRIFYIFGTNKYSPNAGELQLKIDPSNTDSLCIENALKKQDPLDKVWLDNHNLYGTHCDHVKLD